MYVDIFCRGAFFLSPSSKHVAALAGQMVAVKKVTILEEITEARRVFREIKILRNLRHANVLSITEIVAVKRHSLAETSCLPAPPFDAPCG
jgi:hypothetical protein